MPDAPADYQHRLTELGLTSYEAKVYLTLIQRESYSAAELATQAGIPRQRVYDVLNSLIQRGLARDWPGQLTRYSAIAPETAVERLLAVQRRALFMLVTKSADLASELAETWSTGRDETAPLDYVEVLREPALLAERFRELQREVKHELLTFSKQPYAVINNTVGLAATKRVAASGGDVRCVYEAGVLDDPRLVAETLEFIEAGEIARVSNDVPLKLCLTDGNRALFSLTDPVAGGLTSTNILIEHRALAQSFRLTFEALWATSEPFEAALRRHHGTPRRI
jgi:hypothetical protein